MRIVDCHVHVTGEVDPAEMIRTMDANGVDRMIILSQAERKSLDKTRENLLYTRGLRGVTATVSAVLLMVMVLVASLMDFVFMDVRLGTLPLVGAAILLGSMVLVSLRGADRGGPEAG